MIKPKVMNERARLPGVPASGGMDANPKRPVMRTPGPKRNMTVTHFPDLR